MADVYAPTSASSELPQKDVDRPGYRYAKALCESARANAAPYVGKFKGYWDFLLGKGHWPRSKTQAARLLDGWSFRGVVNDLFAVVDTKAASITGASSKTFAEPLDENSTYMDRLFAQSALDHELERLRFKQVRKDCYLWGSACGIGLAMVTAKPDSVTGEMALQLKAINPSEFFWDPSADNLTDCRFVVWEPLLDMSVVRQMFPSKAQQVRPLNQTAATTFDVTYNTTTNDQNLFFGTGGEFLIDQTNTLKARRARVSFVWIKDPDSLIEELRETVLRQPTDGYECVSCGTVYEATDVAGDSCPTCAGDLQQVKIPAKVQTDRVMRRQYPYGRLIVYSGDTLLYDGENPYELEGVFPFAAYRHYRLPGVFPGFGDVALLRSLQEETGTTIGQGVDYVRLGVNGPFIYPSTFKSLTDLGNGPNERHPGPPVAQWLPQFVSPNGFNVQAWTALIATLERKFNTVSGISPLGFGQTSSPPISATEAELAVQGPSNRLKGHAEEFAQFCSDLAQIVYDMGRQYYESTRNVPIQMPGTNVLQPTIKNTEVEWSELKPVKVRMEIGLEEAQLDKLHGQVLQGFVAQGGLASPDADILLQRFGLSPAEIRELMQRRAFRQEQGAPPALPTPMGEPAGLGAPAPSPMPMGGP